MRRHGWPVLLLGFALFPRGQEVPRGDVFGGYSWTRSRGENWSGWSASGAVYLVSWFGIAADVTGHYKTLSNTGFSLYSAAIGPRVAWQRDNVSWFVPFIQAQAGAFRTKAHTDFLGASFSEDDTHGGAVFGGGVDLLLSDRWAVRVKGDYAVVRSPGHTDGDPRASAGLVLFLGRMPQ